MLFSSIPFLYYFLPCVILLYFAAPKRLKNSVLLFSSLFFYAWGEPRYITFMIFSVTQGYFFGLLIEKYRGNKSSKALLSACVLLSLGLLCYCKYADFFLENFNAITGLSIPLLEIMLPIGISFYTFQVISYAVDVYRGFPAQKNYINLAAYITMFPQLIAGPIVRYSDIAKQLENRSYSLQSTATGIRRFVIGLSKKILLANVLGELVATFHTTQERSVLFYWMYALSYTLQIYFDFSGYSDMAIGLGSLFGFSFNENFNYPYISGSITEFWRRWHISLGTWFRDYLYIPLGGNRVGKPRWIFNILVVWMATGLWHGASWNFIVWGLLFAVLLMAEKLWLLPIIKKLRVLNHIYVLFFVVISFVIFDSANLSEAFSGIYAMLGGANLPAFTAESLYYLKSYGVVLIISVFAATPFPKMLLQRSGKMTVAVAEPIFSVSMLAVCTAFLIDGSFNPFLYFRF